MMETTRKKDEREREGRRKRKQNETEMQNRKKEWRRFLCVVASFLTGSALLPKKIKQPTIRPRSVCVHACQILRSFSTLLKWSLFFSVSFWLTLFYHCHQYFKHIYKYTFNWIETHRYFAYQNTRESIGCYLALILFLSHALEILSIETNVNVDLIDIGMDVMSIS